VLDRGGNARGNFVFGEDVVGGVLS
jgi:hypothetical protein